MSNLENDISEVELTIKQAKDAIALKDAVVKLSNNREFRKIITEGYFKNEAARLTHLFSDPTILLNNQQEMVRNDLLGIGGLERYLRVLVQQGNAAQDALMEQEETLDELRSEVE